MNLVKISLSNEEARDYLEQIGNSSNIFMVCKGYAGDSDFTELVWEDDKYLDFLSEEYYFEIWIKTDLKLSASKSAITLLIDNQKVIIEKCQ